MITVPQSVELLAITPNPEILIEKCGRTCYKSSSAYTAETASKFILSIMDKGHTSVIEHASATFRIITDRGVSHELVRHRLASFSQESTRYCNYAKASDLIFIQSPISSEEQYNYWLSSCTHAEEMYLAMLEVGATPQIARSVLPNSLKTEIVMTANFREWVHFVNLRYREVAGKVHPQMKQVAKAIHSVLVELAPTVFGYFAESEAIRLKKELTHWKANHEDLRIRLEACQYRVDLPAERIEAVNALTKKIDELRSKIAEMTGIPSDLLVE